MKTQLKGSQLIVRREDTHTPQENKNNIEVSKHEDARDFANHIRNTNDSDVNNKQQTPIIKTMLFDQKQQLRSEKIYYFDHPLMGMIIQIRKIP